MQCITGRAARQRQWGAIGHTLAIVGLIALTAMGVSLESSGGRAAYPPSLVGGGTGWRQRRRQRHWHSGFAWREGWDWLRRTWMVTAVRSEGLMGLVYLTDWQEWEWVCVLPGAIWLWKGLGVACPGLGRRPLYRGLGRLMEEGSRLAFVGLGMVWLSQHMCMLGDQRVCAISVGQVGKCVEVQRDDRGVYHVRIRGEFEIHVDGNVEMYRRVLVIFLGSLQVPGETRGSRRTRDGRTPFVRQQPSRHRHRHARGLSRCHSPRLPQGRAP